MKQQLLDRIEDNSKMKVLSNFVTDVEAKLDFSQETSSDQKKKILVAYNNLREMTDVAVKSEKIVNDLQVMLVYSNKRFGMLSLELNKAKQ